MIMTYFITLKSLEKCYSLVVFSKTMKNTSQHKIKSFTMEQQHFNKLILYKRSIVKLLIYNMNGIINITMM